MEELGVMVKRYGWKCSKINWGNKYTKNYKIYVLNEWIISYLSYISIQLSQEEEKQEPPQPSYVCPGFSQ